MRIGRGESEEDGFVHLCNPRSPTKDEKVHCWRAAEEDIKAFLLACGKSRLLDARTRLIVMVGRSLRWMDSTAVQMTIVDGLRGNSVWVCSLAVDFLVQGFRYLSVESYQE